MHLLSGSPALILLGLSDGGRLFTEEDRADFFGSSCAVRISATFLSSRANPWDFLDGSSEGMGTSEGGAEEDLVVIFYCPGEDGSLSRLWLGNCYR